MSTGPVTRPADAPTVREEKLPRLESGDRLDQPTFHARYEAMPAGTRAELIGGIVHMPSPLKRPHGRGHSLANWWLTEYEFATPGVETLDSATHFLGPENEPQPDVCLRILPENGGQTSEKDEYIVGAPELIVEIASSSESIDLHGKKADYERFGVREYVVAALRQRRLYWFVLRDEQLVEHKLGPDGIYRSEVYPGLWLDPAALLTEDKARVREVLNAGLASPVHTAFVARLEAHRSESSP